MLEGEIHVDKYEKDGENRTYTYVTATNVEFCGSKNSGEPNQGESLPDLKVVKDKIDAFVEDTGSDGDFPF